MLIQSHEGVIHLLPCLPESWQSGRVNGLRVRGGFEIDMSWEEGKLSRLLIKSLLGNACRIRFGEKQVVLKTLADGSCLLNGALEIQN